MGMRLLVLVAAMSCAAPGWSDWPQFRGPDGQGHANASDLPVVWSETQNIRWKAPIPGKGWSSPVIAGDQIWLTTALDEARSLRAICVNLKDGKITHDVEVFHWNEEQPVHAKNSHATPTAVVDGNRVYVHFGAFGTACLSTGGEVLWKSTVLKYRQPYSAASCPVVFGDLLILSCDGTDAQFLAAIDKRTGKLAWKSPRQHLAAGREKAKKEPASRHNFPLMAYSTPLIIDVDGAAQLVSPAADHVASYDPFTGKEIWWCGYDGFSLVARPVYGRRYVYVAGFEQQSKPVLFAIQPTVKGEVTRDELVFTYRMNVSHVPSPLLVGDEIFMAGDAGVVTCIDATTGTLHWRQRIGGNYSASPVVAKGRIYFLSEEGKTTVVAAAKTFEKLADNQLDGRFLASPAVAGRSLILRSHAHLYRIEEKSGSKSDSDL